MANYEVWLTDDVGLRIRLLDDLLSLTATHVVNEIGAFSLALPDYFDTSLIIPDRQIQVWRAPHGGALSLWRSYFVRRWQYATVGSQDNLVISGPDVNHILDRRIIAYYAETPQTVKTTIEADNMMKDFVTENLVTSADYSGTVAARNLSTYFSVDVDLTAGPQLTRRAAFGRLFDILKDLAEASREAGTEVFFDVQPNVIGTTSISYIFRTFTGQPGADRGSTSDIRTVFDQARGNLEDPALTYDYTNERNVAYAGGQGEASNRVVSTCTAVARSAASFWARYEEYVEARSEETANGVYATARAAIVKGRPRRLFSGRPVDTAGTRFGVDWNWGDKVVAIYRGLEFDTIIRGVQLTVTPREGERIDAVLEYEGA